MEGMHFVQVVHGAASSLPGFTLQPELVRGRLSYVCAICRDNKEVLAGQCKDEVFATQMQVNVPPVTPILRHQLAFIAYACHAGHMRISDGHWC